MRVRFVQKVLLRLIPSPLFLMAFGVLAVPVTVQVQAQPRVRLTLNISIKDKASNAPVKNVEISIPRQGTNSDGVTLQEIKVTLPDGTLVRPDTDFELTGTPHQLIILRAEGFVIGSPIELADEVLKQAALKPDHVLDIPIKLPATGTTGESTVASSPSAKGSPSASPSPGSTSTTGGWIGSLTGGLNYSFWVLGLVIFCVVGGLVLLVVLTRIFRRGSIEYPRRILRFAPLLAQAFVWPFGYRLTFSLLYKREANPAETYIRIINASLVRLLDNNTTLSGAQADLAKIRDNLARLVGPNDPATGIEEYLNGVTASLEQLSRRSAPPGGEMPNSDSLMRALKEAMHEALREFKPDLLKEFKPDLLAATPISGSSADAGATPPNIKDISLTIRDSNDQKRVKLLYQRFLDHQPLECKPVYLESVVKGSPLGKLADDSVYLSRVGGSQAPFVLLIEQVDGAVGWVFPNPALAFDRSTLKDVFPALSEAQFNEAREQIDPVAVSKVDERNWRVD